jgi:hypothetical protein
MLSYSDAMLISGLLNSKVAESASLLSQVLNDLHENLGAWFSAFIFNRRRDLNKKQ